MSKLVLIDGNSIMNRAFYGIMGSKMLTTNDGTYTNAVYGFLAILFKIIEEYEPEYIAVTFDLKGPTKRHEKYEGYKANRKGMPDELAQQMPMIKEILRDMNIAIIEKQGYEGDDIIGTLSKQAEKQGLDVVILSGDRDTFQLASSHITIHIPRTKMGKTEVDDFDEEKVKETYGLEPQKLIEVKGLMGDSSDNIPGIPGVGEKTALSLIKEFGSIENMYQELEEGKAISIKGKTREKIIENKELAFLSKELGTIDTQVPLEEELGENKFNTLLREEWDYAKVYEEFKKLKFNRYIDRFHLREKVEEGGSSEEIQQEEKKYEIKIIEQKEENEIQKVLKTIQKEKKLVFYLGTELEENKQIIQKKIVHVYIAQQEKIIVIPIASQEQFCTYFKSMMEDQTIEKVSHHLSEVYVLLRQNGIQMSHITFDTKIAAYLLNPTGSKYEISMLANDYLTLDKEEFLEKQGLLQEASQTKQMNLFDTTGTKQDERKQQEEAFLTNAIAKLEVVFKQKLQEVNQWELFCQIEMPVLKVLAEMQYTGMYVDKGELEDFGNQMKEQLEALTKEIYQLAGEEFNINSTQQLGTILFEKLGLTSSKKTKKGYSTDVDALEKIRKEHPIVEKILEYRSLMKLNSTYVEGLMPYINETTNRIHSYFHQTVTATGRISSSEPNLQNIPTRIEFGKRLRKVFKPKEGYLYIDADYSQIELRVLADISQDEHMLEAFRKGEDIHKQAASKVLGIPIEKVNKEQRSKAKAVNFGIVYGISDFGLAEQIGVSRKEARKYIHQYLEKYNGIKNFMEQIVEEAKEKGYVETKFHRRRYIPELTSNNYMVRQFGSRAAMNTPIQGTAADIMKIAMVNLSEELKKQQIDAKIVLQVHDELLLEAKIEEKEKAKEILKQCMESAACLSVPLEVDVSEAANWYEAK